MRVYLIFLLIIYFLYSTVKSLWEHGLPFDTVHWILAAMCVAFVPLAVIFGKRSWLQSKQDKAKREEERKKAAEEAAERKRELYRELDGADAQEPGEQAPAPDGAAPDAPAEGSAAAPEAPASDSGSVFDN